MNKEQQSIRFLGLHSDFYLIVHLRFLSESNLVWVLVVRAPIKMDWL